MNRLAINTTALFILGLGAGWYAHKAAQTDTKSATTPANADKLNIQTDPTVAEPAIESALTTLQPAKTEANYEANAHSIVEYIKQRSQDPTYGGMGDRELRNLIYRTPGLAHELLEQLITLEEGSAKHNLTQLLLGLHLVMRANLDNWIVEKMKLGQQTSQWLAVLGELGAQSSDTLLFVNDLLPRLSDPRDVQAAISAVTGLGAEQIGIAPSERQKLIDNITPYLDSDNHMVRAAAISSLQNYPSDDLETQILKALNDPSKRVRSSALMVFANRAPHSDTLKTQAIINAQDQTFSPLERRSIVQLLSTSSLTPNEQEILNQVADEIRNLFSTMSQEELIEYARKEREN